MLRPAAPALALVLLCAMACLGLLGCGGPQHRSSPYGPPRQDASSAQQRALELAARGYPGAPQTTAGPSDPLPVTVMNQQWIVKGSPLAVTLLTPAGDSTKLPLLIYLPGLGESATAGAHWRYAWARAGYAVLSFQALEADRTAWSSELARAADFKALALQHQQPHLLQDRLRILRAALAQALARAASAEPPWARVDTSRIGVVGYDLGAATAMAWAASLGPLAEGQARAAILLSPSGLTRESTQQALAEMPAHLPLLAINSQRAADLNGVLESAAERTRFFEQLPHDANKYLLLLSTPSHAALSGASGMAESPNEPVANGLGRRVPPSQMGQAHAIMSPAPPPMLSDKGNQEAGVIVEHISSAFLNQHLRESQQARLWLRQSASAWLGELGELRLR